MSTSDIQRELHGTAMETALMKALSDGGRSSLTAVAETVGDVEAAAVAVERLMGLRLVENERPTAEVTLSLLGRKVGAAIRKSKMTGPGRRAAVQRALLQWLTSGAEPDEVGEFAEHEVATSAGVAFSEEEIRRAAYALVFWELITSPNASPHQVQRPRVTDHGRKAADDTRTPHEFVRAMRATTASIRDSGGSLTGGSSARGEADGQDTTTLATRPVSSDSRILVMAKATEVLEVLGPDVNPDVRAAIEAVRDEAASIGPTVGSLNGKTLTALVTAVSAGVGQQIVEGVAKLAQFIT